MASNLAAALMGGGGNEAAAFGLDPTLAAALPDLQLGSSLMQEGLSTAPAYPMQAFARLAQTLAGNYIRGGAVSDLAKAYAHTAENAAATLPDGALKSALLSSDPLVRMQGLQAYQKGLTLLTQPENLAPGHRTVIGAGQENTGPMSGPGELQRDIDLATRTPGGAAPRTPGAPGPSPLVPPAAGAGGNILPNGEEPIAPSRSPATTLPTSPLQGAIDTEGAIEAAKAKAKAPYEAGGEGVTVNPDGSVTKVPLTAETRAAMQPRPSGPITPTRVQTTSFTQGPGGGVVETPTGAPAAPAAAPAAPAIRGEPVPNEAAHAQAEADIKEVQGDRDKASAGQQDMTTVRAIQDFLPKVRTGWSAENRLEGARILKGMGVPDDQVAQWTKTDPAAGQLLQKKFLELSSAAARTLGAREPGSVISMFAKAYPNIGTDEHAINLQTNAIYMGGLRQQNLANAKSDYLNESINDPNYRSGGPYRGLKGFNDQFNKTHPAENYLSAAEAMSGDAAPWNRIKNPQQQKAVIDLIPPGRDFWAPPSPKYPKGIMLTKPGASINQ